jgi:hypothetical protein
VPQHETINKLTFVQQLAVYNALKDATEPAGEDGFCRYKDKTTDKSMAERMTGEVGARVTEANVGSIRRASFGQLRHSGGTNGNTGSRAAIEALTAKIDALQAVVASQATRLENLRKVVEHFDAEQHRRRAECTNRLRGAIGKQRADERTVRTQMRGDGYSDEEISMAMYLAGAVVRQNGAGSTVEIPPR